MRRIRKPKLDSKQAFGLRQLVKDKTPSQVMEMLNEKLDWDEKYFNREADTDSETQALQWLNGTVRNQALDYVAGSRLQHEGKDSIAEFNEAAKTTKGLKYGEFVREQFSDDDWEEKVEKTVGFIAGGTGGRKAKIPTSFAADIDNFDLSSFTIAG